MRHGSFEFITTAGPCVTDRVNAASLRLSKKKILSFSIGRFWLVGSGSAEKCFPVAGFSVRCRKFLFSFKQMTKLGHNFFQLRSKDKIIALRWGRIFFFDEFKTWNSYFFMSSFLFSKNGILLFVLFYRHRATYTDTNHQERGHLNRQRDDKIKNSSAGLPYCFVFMLTFFLADSVLNRNIQSWCSFF